MLAGNVVALLSPMIYVPILTYAFGPQNYDYKSMALIRLGDDSDVAADAHVDLELVPGVSTNSEEQNQKEKATLDRASIIAKSLTAFLTVALLVLWPMPMYGSSYVFSGKFFTGWVSVGILWLFCSSFCVGLYPLWEGRHSMAHTFKGIVADIRGRGKPTAQSRRSHVVEESEGSDSGHVGDEKESASPVVEKGDE